MELLLWASDGMSASWTLPSFRNPTMELLCNPAGPGPGPRQPPPSPHPWLFVFTSIYLLSCAHFHSLVLVYSFHPTQYHLFPHFFFTLFIFLWISNPLSSLAPLSFGHFFCRLLWGFSFGRPRIALQLDSIKLPDYFSYKKMIPKKKATRPTSFSLLFG